MLAYLALGSNLGDRRQFLRSVILQLQDLADDSLRSSRVYETDPVRDPQGQGAYLNLVVSFESDLEPLRDLAPELLPSDWEENVEPGKAWPVGGLR